DKAELVQSLLDTKGATGAFQTYADIIALAASIGAKYQKRIPVKDIAKSEPAPISLEIFISRGYDWLIKLLAVNQQQTIEIIGDNSPENEVKRALIFEEYANGGLEKLKDNLRGAVDSTDRLLLILNGERMREKTEDETELEFDLTRFL
ncbi:MAG: DNA phosphorothioation-associated protein 4, partial [Cyanobacteria bacterium J083]